MPIDGIGELGILLYTRAGAAPERIILGVEGFPGARSERKIILRVSGLRLDGAEAHVEHRAFVVVEIARIRGPLVQVTCELQHVVRTAALFGRDGALQFAGELARLREPSFAVAGSGGGIGPRAGHFVPEIIGDRKSTRLNS